MSNAAQCEPATAAATEGELLDVLLPQVSRFLAAAVDGFAIDRDGRIPPSVREGIARLGLFGMTLPEAYGGAGLSLGAACRVVAELARVDRSVAIMVGLHAGLGTRGLVELGSPALRARWLPRLASGDCIASFAATEAGAGSALTAIATKGRVVDGGLRIDGEKSYVTNGGFAGLFTVLVRTPGLGGERAQSLVCVPAGTRGLGIGAEETKLGIRGSSTVTVSFDDVRVPLDHVLGSPGDGMQQANDTPRVGADADVRRVRRLRSRRAGRHRGLRARATAIRRPHRRLRGDARARGLDGRAHARHGGARPKRGRRPVGRPPDRPRLDDREGLLQRGSVRGLRPRRSAPRRAGLPRGDGHPQAPPRHAHHSHLRGGQRRAAPAHRDRGAGHAIPCRRDSAGPWPRRSMGPRRRAGRRSRSVATERDS